ncbi:MAG: iron-siderophore ABC transporter substrate-binding protein [Goleter apudmare HA4340-LM2]|jgi:iron complex transport system substrate-binding protein|nr:iron-siderophore ABC transporter substrate-binding protein [Goleter apudmare HA4340-LM2]
MVSACNKQTGDTLNSLDTSPWLSSSSTRIVKHAGGETKIPLKPQRIITLHDSTILDPVLALGIKPIGVATYSPRTQVLFRGITKEQVANIQHIGSISQPSLERILMLKPDLILGRELHKDIYSRLANIAPTVLIDWNSFTSFQDNFHYISQVLGKEEEAKQVLNYYQERIQKLQQRMGKEVQEMEVSVIAISGQNFKSYNNKVVFNQVLDSAGVKRSLIQLHQKEFVLNLSIEFLSKYDADILFVINESNTQLQSYLNNPIWSQLKAVQNKQVYEVETSNWFGLGPLGANKILDDLFKYLVK